VITRDPVENEVEIEITKTKKPMCKIDHYSSWKLIDYNYCWSTAAEKRLQVSSQ
jgi:hypothetical protein